MKKSELSRSCWCFWALVVFLAVPGYGQEFTVKNASFNLHAQAVQSTGVPILLTITIKNATRDPISFWCGGPGRYPHARFLSAQCIDSSGKTQPVVLKNWQYDMGSGRGVEVKADESIDLPAAVDPLPAGTYSLTVENSKPLVIEVRNDDNLKQAYENAVIAGVRGGDPFFIEVAAHNQDAVVDVALLHDLLSDDLKIEKNSGYALTLFQVGLPPDTVQVCGQVLTRRLASMNPKTREGYDKSEVLSLAVQILAKCGTDEALTLIIGLSHSHAIDGLADLAGQGNQLRRIAVSQLRLFPQLEAMKELQSFLNDQDQMVQFAALEALAFKKDPMALEVLLRIAQNSKHSYQAESLNLLTWYRNDPRIKSTLVKALRSDNSMVRDEAKFALQQLKGQP